MTDNARVTDEQALVEWTPPSTGLIKSEQAFVEWTVPGVAFLKTETAFIEWARAEAGVLLGEIALVEWVPGNVLTADKLKLRIDWSQGGQANGDMFYRSLADFALAQLERGGLRNTLPSDPPDDGDGFPLKGGPPPTPPPGGGAGLARYKSDLDDSTDWGPPLV